MPQAKVHPPIFPSFCLLLIFFVCGTLCTTSPWPCFDEEPLCAHLVRNLSCYGAYQLADRRIKLYPQHATKVQSICRAGCRRHFEANQHQLSREMIETFTNAGGANDTVQDPFGFSYDACDLSKGFTAQGRENLISYWEHFYGTENGMYSRVPMFTQAGFEKVQVPKLLWGDIRDFYRNGKKKPGWSRENTCVPGIHYCSKAVEDDQECSIVNVNKMERIKLTQEMIHILFKYLHGVAEEWSGVKLDAHYAFGIRRYKRGSWMSAHIDTIKTHVISAIINVGQKVDEPWPLDIFDHNRQHHQVFMKPGEMIWYESARLLHGRVQPLNGKYYDNIFVHFSPVSFRNLTVMNYF